MCWREVIQSECTYYYPTIHLKIANMVKIYESMEPANAADILEDVGELNISMVVEICKNMKTAKFSEILQEMDTSFAAILCERMAN